MLSLVYGKCNSVCTDVVRVLEKYAGSLHLDK